VGKEAITESRGCTAKGLVRTKGEGDMRSIFTDIPSVIKSENVPEIRIA
jgi:hypothetical protein